jgi:hypothetical protein
VRRGYAHREQTSRPGSARFEQFLHSFLRGIPRVTGVPNGMFFLRRVGELDGLVSRFQRGW